MLFYALLTLSTNRNDSDDNDSHTHPFNGPLSGTTQVSRYQKGKTNLDCTEARDSEWQWHQLGHMQVCTSLQTDNHTSTPPLRFLQAGCPSCRPTDSVKALKAMIMIQWLVNVQMSITTCGAWSSRRYHRRRRITTTRRRRRGFSSWLLTCAASWRWTASWWHRCRAHCVPRWPPPQPTNDAAGTEPATPGAFACRQLEYDTIRYEMLF